MIIKIIYHPIGYIDAIGNNYVSVYLNRQIIFSKCFSYLPLSFYNCYFLLYSKENVSRLDRVAFVWPIRSIVNTISWFFVVASRQYSFGNAW